MKKLICKECGQPRNKGRRLCKACDSKRISKYPRYVWTKNCEICGDIYQAWRKSQKNCKKCHEYKLNMKTTKANNQYISTNKPGVHVHRHIAQEILNRKLSTNEVVHHIDENPKNNKIDNLMVMTRHHHVKLHMFLDHQRAIYEVNRVNEEVDQWDNLRSSLTDFWIKDNKANIIKLIEV